MLVPIGAADIKEYHGEEIPVKARLYANKSFKTSEGIFIHNGHQDDPNFYQEFDLTYDGLKVRIEAGDAYSTTDSDQPDATYDLDAYDADGGFLFHIFARLSIVNVSPLTWDAIVEDSKSVHLKSPPTYMSTEAIEARLAQLTNTAFRSSSTMIGTTKLDVDPADLTNPIAVGVNSPLLLVGGSLAGSGVYGRTRLDTAPASPTDPVAVGANSPILAPIRHLNGYADLPAAIAAGPGIIPITQPITISANLATPDTNTLSLIGAGKIVVGAGVTLVVGGLLDPGNRKIFDLTATDSHVLFGYGSVDHYNIAWFAGTHGGDATRAINECLAIAQYANKGGTIYIPDSTIDWTTTGGHLWPQDAGVTLKGFTTHPDANKRSRLLMAVDNATMFIVQNYAVSMRVENMMFHGNGHTNVKAFSFNAPAGTHTTHVLVQFDRVAIVGFTRGIDVDAIDGFTDLLSIDHCGIRGNTEAGIYWNQYNGGMRITDTLFDIIPDHAAAIILGNAPFIQIRDCEIGSQVGTVGSFFINKIGYVGNLTIEGCRDENDEFFINDSSGNGSTGEQVNLHNNYIGGRIFIDTAGAYNSRGNNYYFNEPFEYSGVTNPYVAARVHSYGDNLWGNDRGGGPAVANPRMTAAGDPAILVVTEASNADVAIYNYYHHKVLEYGLASDSVSATDPLQVVASDRTDRDLVAWGSYLETDRRTTRADYRTRYLNNGKLEWRFLHSIPMFANYGGMVLKNFPLITPPVRPAVIPVNVGDYNVGQAGNLIHIQSSANILMAGFTFDSTQLDGQWFMLVNVGNFNIDLLYDHASATATNRMRMTTGAGITLTPNQQAFFQYDNGPTAPVQRWRVSKMN